MKEFFLLVELDYDEGGRESIINGGIAHDFRKGATE